MRTDPPKAFTAKFATLMTFFNRELDDDLTEPRAYWAALADIPLRLLLLSCDRAVKTRKFFPRVAELREDAEAERVAILRAHPHQHCGVCRETRGWLSVFDAKGVQRLQRCGCFSAYMERLRTMGVGEPVVQRQLTEGDES